MKARYWLPMKWDDLRVLEAVRNEGGYARAAARLKIDETTVARRLARLQDALGLTLFDLVDGERRPTAQCEAIIAHIEAMSRHAKEIGAVAVGQQGPVGKFRIAVTNALAETILAPRAGTLLAANPGLTLQFLTSSENVNFSRWEADIAIRLRKPVKGDFFISKLADAKLYWLEPVDRPARDGPVVCRYPDELAATPEAQVLMARGLDRTARCITDNIRVIRGLIEAGAAAGVLPEYLCADLLSDTRLQAMPIAKSREVWLLVQNHLKRNAAARIVIDWIRRCFAETLVR